MHWTPRLYQNHQDLDRGRVKETVRLQLLDDYQQHHPHVFVEDHFAPLGVCLFVVATVGRCCDLIRGRNDEDRFPDSQFLWKWSCVEDQRRTLFSGVQMQLAWVLFDLTVWQPFVAAAAAAAAPLCGRCVGVRFC